MSTMPVKISMTALLRLKAFVASALSFGSVRWRLLAVLFTVSLVAYGFLLYGQYRDQYDRILSSAQSSNRLLTEVMTRRIETAVQKLDTLEINRTLLDMIKATEIASSHWAAPKQGQTPTVAAGDLSAALIAFGVIRPDGTILKAYHSALRLDLSEQVLADLAQEVVKTGATVDRIWSNAHVIALPVRGEGSTGAPIAVVAVAWDLSHHFAAAGQAIREDAVKGALATIVVLLVLLYVVHRIVTQPIMALTRHVAQLSMSGDLELIDDALAQRRDEIGVLASEFNKMVEALADSRQKLQNQSYVHGMAEMASGVLHNIRNALNPISVGIWKLEESARGTSLGRIETALAELANEATPLERRQKLAGYTRAAVEKLVAQQHALADEIHELGQHSRHIEQILQDVDLSGRRRRKPEAINLDKLAEECAAMIPGRAESPITVEIDPALARLPAALGNRITLTQVIGNLMVNAAESIRMGGISNGRIAVTGYREAVDGKDMLHLEVRDNGGGIAPDAMASLFQRGFSTKQEKKGGIGLHWCANSVIAMNGKIHATSDGAGLGATFHLLLPAAPQRAEGRTQAA
ncbi:MAG TPA: ATP-binding protein [Candidatus Angelobacter sp.]|nr:ATP-binding protein [Candidatus Angelobacter sp.]